jgi:hypothetical protein
MAQNEPDTDQLLVLVGRGDLTACAPGVQPHVKLPIGNSDFRAPIF